MTEPRTITCCVCREELPADDPDWTRADNEWICGECARAAAEPWPTMDEYSRGPDAAGGVDMAPWQAWGEYKGKN